MAEMGEIKSCFMIVMILLFLSSSMNRVSAAPSEEECKLERKLGGDACKPVVFGKPPSPYCCERARVTDFDCVCPLVTPRLAALIDVNRVIRLIEGCGRRVPRHFKCGSITTP